MSVMAGALRLNGSVMVLSFYSYYSSSEFLLSRRYPRLVSLNIHIVPRDLREAL